MLLNITNIQKTKTRKTTTKANYVIKHYEANDEQPEGSRNTSPLATGTASGWLKQTTGTTSS